MHLAVSWSRRLSIMVIPIFIGLSSEVGKLNDYIVYWKHFLIQYAGHLAHKYYISTAWINPNVNCIRTVNEFWFSLNFQRKTKKKDKQKKNRQNGGKYSCIVWTRKNVCTDLAVKHHRLSWHHWNALIAAIIVIQHQNHSHSYIAIGKLKMRTLLRDSRQQMEKSRNERKEKENLSLSPLQK